MIGIDLFSGAGGLSLGAEMAGVNVAIAVESDPYAAQTYRVNHPRTLIINEDISIAISDVPSLEVERILNLGIQLGYFHSSTIGRKDGKSGGRTKLYILNRRLSPIWTLDPTAFAGYLFVQNALLESAMVEPFRLLRRLGKDMPNEEMYQLTLFDDFEGKPFYVEEFFL